MGMGHRGSMDMHERGMRMAGGGMGMRAASCVWGAGACDRSVWLLILQLHLPSACCVAACVLMPILTQVHNYAWSKVMRPCQTMAKVAPFDETELFGCRVVTV